MLFPKSSINFNLILSVETDVQNAECHRKLCTLRLMVQCLALFYFSKSVVCSHSILKQNKLPIFFYTNKIEMFTKYYTTQNFPEVGTNGTFRD